MLTSISKSSSREHELGHINVIDSAHRKARYNVSLSCSRVSVDYCSSLGVEKCFLLMTHMDYFTAKGSVPGINCLFELYINVLPLET